MTWYPLHSSLKLNVWEVFNHTVCLLFILCMCHIFVLVYIRNVGAAL